jgi:hypothetical protein
MTDEDFMESILLTEEPHIEQSLSIDNAGRPLKGGGGGVMLLIRHTPPSFLHPLPVLLSLPKALQHLYGKP